MLEERLLQLAKKESTIWEKRISKEVEEERRLFQANINSQHWKKFAKYWIANLAEF